MGEPVLDCARVPCLLGEGPVLRAPVEALGRRFEVTPVSMGNPHGVIFTPDVIGDADLRRYGAALEQHPAFPEKVNIEFVTVLAPDRLRMRVWERGSGVTLACGTGACAALVASVLCGLCERRAQVELDGGTLEIGWDEPSGHVLMTGPATHVFDGELDGQG